MDVVKSPLQPWLLSHGFQRLAAKRERSADQLFRTAFGSRPEHRILA